MITTPEKMVNATQQPETALIEEISAVMSFEVLDDDWNADMNDPSKQPVASTLLNIVPWNDPGNLWKPNGRDFKAKFDSVQIYEPDTDELRDVADFEFESAAFTRSIIRFEMRDGSVLNFNAKNGEYFTLRELLGYILEKEQLDRQDWLDPDRSFFEGLDTSPEGLTQIIWGS